MEHIFHEKQEGALCAQHCLNALLQGPYYTAVDLAELAEQLDDAERRRMAEGREGQGAGADDDEYQRFLARPSANMDDTGFFSVQVIAKAIEVWGLEIVSFNASEDRAKAAKDNPVGQRAFICNYREHWFSIRKIGKQWFNLNSLLTGPELISDTFLSLFLAQLQQEQYTIYIVFGDLPACDADQILRLCPAVQTERPQLLSEAAGGATAATAATGRRAGTAAATAAVPAAATEEEQLQKAMAMSLGMSSSEDDDLKLALQLSQSLNSSPSTSQSAEAGAGAGASLLGDEEVALEEDSIQQAIRMSLEDASPKKSPASAGAGAGAKHPSSSAASATGALPKSLSNPAAAQLASPPEPKISRPSAGFAAGASASARSPRTPAPRTSTSASLASGQPKKIATLSDTKKSGDHSEDPSVEPPAGVRPLPRTPLSTTSSSFSSSTSASGRHLGGASGLSSAMVRQTTPDPEEVRRRRMAFLDKMEKDKKEKMEEEEK